MNIIRFIVVLGLNRLSVSNLLTFGRSVKAAMTGNANFPTPEPTLTVLNTAINNLSNEKTAPFTPGKTARVRQYAIELRQVLTELGYYVESVANVTPSDAVSVIESAGMRVKRSRTTPDNGFRLKTTGSNGEIEARTKSANRATFEFQTTVTPADETTYVKVYSGTRASCIARSLDSGKRYYFRVRKTDKDGEGDWSNVLNIIVP